MENECKNCMKVGFICEAIGTLGKVEGRVLITLKDQEQHIMWRKIEDCSMRGSERLRK